MPSGRKALTFDEIFLKHVHPCPLTGCWNWAGTFNKSADGDVRYGITSFNGKTILAHRLFYEQTYKVSLKTSEYVCHKCDNPGCVNPDHLFVGSQQENMDDCVAKNRSRKGYKNHKVKLKEEQIPKIRRLYAQGFSTTEIARTYNVHRRTIYGVVHGERWAWLNG